jgi:hypothetical protein
MWIISVYQILVMIFLFSWRAQRSEYIFQNRQPINGISFYLCLPYFPDVI